MTPTLYQHLYRYNYWAHRRVWACVEALSDEQFVAEAPHGVGAPQEQLLHTMAVESWWLHFLKTGELRFIDWGAEWPREAILAAWREVERGALDYVDALTDEELARPVRPDFWDEGTPAIPVWQALLQVANHSTDHRAQLLALLNTLGAPTTEQEYLTFALESAPS